MAPWLRGFVVILALCTSCNQDVRLAGRKIPTVHVGPVMHYGQSLDQQATPEQVAFVALRAIREDFEAASPEARENALAVQFDVCAANEIQARNRTSTARDEFIYKTVRRWTPTVAHYVKSFPTDWEQARTQLVRREYKPINPKPVNEECVVLTNVEDPSGDPNARVVLVMWMVKDGGYWRVTHLSFEPTRRPLVAQNVGGATP